MFSSVCLVLEAIFFNIYIYLRFHLKHNVSDINFNFLKRYFVYVRVDFRETVLDNFNNKSFLLLIFAGNGIDWMRVIYKK